MLGKKLDNYENVLNNLTKKKDLEKLKKDPKIWVPRSSSYSSFLARVHLASISNKITQKPVN